MKYSYKEAMKNQTDTIAQIFTRKTASNGLMEWTSRAKDPLKMVVGDY